MKHKTKVTPHFVKEIEGRSVTGVFAVHGNVDSGLDMSVNGSFARYFGPNRKRARFLWAHDHRQPPIAHIDNLREVNRDELPEKILTYAPDATGGVEVTRTYYEGVELAEWVLTSIRHGDIDEMSYAYDVHGSHEKEIDGKQVRVLTDVEIFDISDVPWGMNPATLGAKSWEIGSDLPLGDHSSAVVSVVDEFKERMKSRLDFRQKEGRTLSTANREKIATLLSMLEEVSAELKQLLADTEPKANADDVAKAFAQFLALESQLNGVTIQ